MNLPQRLNRKHLEDLIWAGRALANAAYNLSQRSTGVLMNSDRDNLASCQQCWDARFKKFLDTTSERDGKTKTDGYLMGR